LPVNCSAIPENLLESQLFGHVKGSFTGAVNSQEGLFQRARGGTIFLDEIGEMPLSLQPKLLRVLEEKTVLPVGSTTPVKVDVRIVAASNRDLKAEVDAGRFREDLYYRLNVFEIIIPPLRKRLEDLPGLVEHLIQRHNIEMKMNYKGVDSATMRILMSLPWKGNIRELDNILERAMILGQANGSGPPICPGKKGTAMISARKTICLGLSSFTKKATSSARSTRQPGTKPERLICSGSVYPRFTEKSKSSESKVEPSRSAQFHRAFRLAGRRY
jgi:transcriptional regulator with PAS, ATPase and Fis domain